MTDQRKLNAILDAFFVDGTDELADRVIDDALDEIDRTQQRHALRLPRRFSAMTISPRLVAAAVLGVLALGGAFYLSRPDQAVVSSPSQSATSNPTLTPSPTTSLPAVVAPNPSRQASTPSPSTEACATDRLELLTGDALPASNGGRLDGLARVRGVYVTGREPQLWAVAPGQDAATLIAAISPQPLLFDVLDISPDGSNALIKVGEVGIDGYDFYCADLYIVRTDGSGATRLTASRAGQFVEGGSFSPDGRRVAYASPGPGTMTVLDLASGATVSQACTSGYSTGQLAWSASGDRIAANCSGNVTVFDPRGTAAPARFPTVGDPMAFTWTDDRHVLVATEDGKTYSFDVDSHDSIVVGHFDDPAIEIAVPSGVFSPDGRWFAYHGGERGDVPGADFTEVAYVVPASGGTPIRVPDEAQLSTAWSDDSQRLIYVDQRQNGLRLRGMDVEALQPSTIGTIRADFSAYFHSYRQGVWRIP